MVIVILASALGVAVLFAVGSGGYARRARRARAIAEARVTEDASRLDALGFEVDLGRRISASLSALIHGLSSSDARLSICEGARSAADAPISVLWELSADATSLEITAASGVLLPDQQLEEESASAAATQAFKEATPVTVTDLAGDDVDRAHRLSRAGAVSAYWQPIGQAGAISGVIEIAWRPPRREPSVLQTAAIAVVGRQAAIVLDRARGSEQLASLAMTDSLTGLPNRRSWDAEIARALSLAKRQRWPLCVAMLDIDHFKEYNDIHGHARGDHLLRAISAGWAGELRASDLLARIGGDEFAAILPDCLPADGEALIERLVTGSEVACSAGLAAWDGVEAGDTLIGRADFALYQSKRAGRGRTVLATDATIFPDGADGDDGPAAPEG